jgi:hemerythrin
MDFIVWCDLFKIGHPIIDEQHQKLIKIVNRFHNEMQKKEKDLLIPDTLNNLIKYVEFHFDEEIKIFQKKDYPDAEIIRHSDIHENIVKDIFKLNERFSQGKYDSIVEVERFVADWIVLHILQEDMKFKYHLKNR